MDGVKMLKLKSTRSEGRRVLRSEKGMGLSEVLVSLMVFSFAILGIVATSARVGMTVNGAHSRLAANAVARQQIETLLAQPAAVSKDGVVTRDGVTMKWTVSSSIAGRKVQLLYHYVLPSGARTDTLTAATVRR
jgi:Tfp pilus assembly protein PilV